MYVRVVPNLIIWKDFSIISQKQYCKTENLYLDCSTYLFFLYTGFPCQVYPIRGRPLDSVKIYIYQRYEPIYTKPFNASRRNANTLVGRYTRLSRSCRKVSTSTKGNNGAFGEGSCKSSVGLHRSRSKLGEISISRSRNASLAVVAVLVPGEPVSGV